MTNVTQIESIIKNMIDSSIREVSATGAFDGPFGGMMLSNHFANIKSQLLESESIPFGIVGLSRNQFEDLVEKCVSERMSDLLDLG